jgi:hypothetical protein
MKNYHFNGLTTIAAPEGADTKDIILSLVSIVPRAVENIDTFIDDEIDTTGNPVIDAKNIAKYIQNNVKYKADGFAFQDIQLPGRMIFDTKQADCKSFSLAIAAQLTRLGYINGFRFASYKANKIPTHVYNWVLDRNNKKHIFDACTKGLKEGTQATKKIDMQVRYLSGPNNINEMAEIAGQHSINAEPLRFPAGFNVGAFVQQLTKAGKSKEEIATALKQMSERYQSVQDAIDTAKPGFIKKVVGKVTLSPVRNAFLALVGLNFRGLAKKILQVKAKNGVQLQRFWQQLGGNYDKLIDRAEKSKNKKPLLLGKKGKAKLNGADEQNEDEAYIGELTLASVGAFLAAAAPAMIAINNLFKRNNIPDTEGEELTEGVDLNKQLPDGNTWSAADPEPESNQNTSMLPDLTTSFKPSPLLIGGGIAAILAIYFLTKKSK